MLALRVPLPWDPDRGVALPILFRLYRSKKRCPETLYRKRTELAAELVGILETWIPASHRLILSGDAEYSCRTLVPRLLKATTFVGPMHMDAALHDPPGKYAGFGRPRKAGRRLATPRQLAASGSTPWEQRTVRIYGREVAILTKTMRCLWRTVAGERLVRMVVTRDPSGRISDRAYFSTEPDMRIEELLQRFSRRWLIEVTFRDLKQLLGLEDPRNGWWRRKQGTRRPRKQAGPKARGRRGQTATLHTTPIVCVSYAIVILWYLEHGRPDEDVRRVREWSPWYRSKRTPSVADMLATLRAEIWAGRLSEDPRNHRSRRKYLERIRDVLRCA